MGARVEIAVGICYEFDLAHIPVVREVVSRAVLCCHWGPASVPDSAVSQVSIADCAHTEYSRDQAGWDVGVSQNLLSV